MEISPTLWHGSAIQLTKLFKKVVLPFPEEAERRSCAPSLNTNFSKLKIVLSSIIRL